MDIVRSDINQQFTIVGKLCDRCGLRVSDSTDFWEFQEFVKINIDVGYATKVFRDGDLMECDLCQRCTSKLLGPYLRVTASFEERLARANKISTADEIPKGRIIWSILDHLD